VVQVRHEVVPYRVFAIFAMPGEEIPLRVLTPLPQPPVVLSTGAASGASPVPARRGVGWTWKAPSRPGLYPLSLENPVTGSSMTLQIFVMVPASEIRGGALNGYRIGHYPSTPLRGLAIYQPPGGFVEVSPENLDTPVAPHFTLGQFLCKQPGAFPKYLVLREKLLLKLEFLLAEVNRRGLRAESFFVMSGFRTPSYNRAIGNVPYSRHQWGGAADIFIDESPKDGVMDDLNGDGKVDTRDADLLFELADGLVEKESYPSLTGGLGLYGATSNHGPFVHVDTRGFPARWGK